MERPTATSNTSSTSATPSADAIEQRVIAFAEQLGRLVGTVQARADGWLDVPALQEQVTRIRDGAASLLSQLGAGRNPLGRKPPVKAGARATAANATGATRPGGGRSGGKVDAPGKKHRKPAPRTPSVKHSDEMISKGNAARQMRRGRHNKG
jgi:hypothetical protein